MDPDTVPALFDHAVESARAAVTEDDDEAVWEVLYRAARSGEPAARFAAARLAAADTTVRATACDLLGAASELHEEVRETAANVLIPLAATEVDAAVQWSIARALGATCDARAVPALVASAGHADAEVRCQVATSLPAVLDDPPADAGVAALIRLCADPDPEVRNWAAFGLGWQSTADGDAVRRALWERTGDSYDEAREEGIRGLARRRDPRAVPLLAGLLAADTAHVFTFEAAAFAAHPALLPLLAEFDPADPGVAGALRECDPARRAHRDALADSLSDALRALLPGMDVALFGERFDLGLALEVTDADHRTVHWSVEGLLERAGNDPDQAARLAADDLAS